uniref:Uncharacterized protein n=1 Tax=Araneus ventricosus TaxID=182803 RepID=A0A4Y2UA62_ARAVE|nr:hypothetical protein AVEN_139390-1 [Araneus ventricosus]
MIHDTDSSSIPIRTSGGSSAQKQAMLRTFYRPTREPAKNREGGDDWFPVSGNCQCMKSEPSTCSFGACRHSFAGLSRPQAVGGRHVEVVSGAASQVPQGVLIGVTAQLFLLPIAVVCLVVKSVLCKKGTLILPQQL